MNILKLDAHYFPVEMIDIERAMYLLVKGRAVPVELDDEGKPVKELGLCKNSTYVWPESLAQLIRNHKFKVPQAIRLTVPVDHKHVRRNHPTRHRIFKRDNHICQYCGSRENLTIDHVIPQSRSGSSDNWSNLVTCCSGCNNKKANRTPEEAGMKLKSKPKEPSGVIMPEFWDRLK